MQKIVSFMLAVVAMFLSFFYGYGSDKVTDKLTPGVDDAVITSDKITLEINDKIKETTSSFTLKATNHTSCAFSCSQEPDIEVLTENGWFDVARTVQMKAGEIKGIVPSNGSAEFKVKSLNTFHLIKGYTYRIVVTFSNSQDTVTAQAVFTV